MKNTIYIGMNKDGIMLQSEYKIAFNKSGYIDSIRLVDYKNDIYGLNLKPLETVSVIIDTETQKFEVKKDREEGLYLALHCNWGSLPRCVRWNGEYFTDNDRFYKECDFYSIGKSPICPPFLPE